VAVSHIEVLAVTAATAAAKVRFNFPRADQCRLPSKAATMTGRNPVSAPAKACRRIQALIRARALASFTAFFRESMS
jgi:hypothetical protein